ncbi:MAG: MobF family relaxase [Lacunisphaera sp.]
MSHKKETSIRFLSHRCRVAKTTMIQTKVQFNLSNAKEYFHEHLGAGDYYSEGQKISGEWIGQGADKLGLKGAVGEDAFIALCEGKHPETGLRLGQRMNSVRHEGEEVKANRRIFYDFTIAPPKSVSVVALTQDDRILKLHENAVRQAMLELEKLAAARIRKSRQKGDRVTGNLVMATFRHETSRKLDPHLHTHCVVFNATFDPLENRWKALQMASMYRAHRFGTNLYRRELSKRPRSLGYKIENHPRGFEIKGVPQSMIDRFSKRHQQINEETNDPLRKGEKVGDIKDLRERVAHGIDGGPVAFDLEQRNATRGSRVDSSLADHETKWAHRAPLPAQKLAGKSLARLVVVVTPG